MTIDTAYTEVERNLDDRHETIQRRITQVDKQIDALVYELYGLTEEEIKIVEGQG